MHRHRGEHTCGESSLLPASRIANGYTRAGLGLAHLLALLEQYLSNVSERVLREHRRHGSVGKRLRSATRAHPSTLKVRP